MPRPTCRVLTTTALAAVSLAVPLVTNSAVSAAAPAQHVRQCNGQDKVLIKRVEGISQHFVATNYVKVRLAKGVSYEQKTVMSTSTTLKASTNITAEVGGSANWGFASISASVKGSVAKEHATTGTRSVSHTFGIAAKPYTRTFVLYSGWTQVKGRWHYLECSRAPGIGTNKHGPIQTFRAQDFGTLLCPHSRYKKNGTLYTIAVEGGC